MMENTNAARSGTSTSADHVALPCASKKMPFQRSRWCRRVGALTDAQCCLVFMPLPSLSASRSEFLAVLSPCMRSRYLRVSNPTDH
uniref:Uncharacterized protein n=1 Tax=Arundo donax TaxID=35708 RepID=A0A0A9D679_ARUDO